MHKRFTRRARAGVWERVFAHLIRDPDTDYFSLASSLVRAHQQAASTRAAPRKGDQALGRSRGRLTTKIHMVVNTLGRPLKLILTRGQPGDAPLAPALLSGLSPRRVPADRAYDSNAIRALVAVMGVEAMMPCNPTRKRAIACDFGV